jgi:YgiT-type zinc finger domain-containing protein
VRAPAATKKAAISLLERRPVYGGELVQKRVEKLLRGGRQTAIIHADALICLKCGERL